MKIALLGGSKTIEYKSLIETKLSVEILMFENIQTDLQTLSVKTDYDVVLILDEGLIIGDKVASTDKLLQIINMFANKNPDIDYIFFTKIPAFYEKTDLMFASLKNVNCFLSETITSDNIYSVLVNKSLNMTETSIVEEKIEEEEIEGLSDTSDEEIIVEPEPDPEPISVPEPAPTPEPKLEKVKKIKPKKVKEPKPQKEKKKFSLFGSKKKLTLGDYQFNNRVFIVTGNPSNGVTSTCDGILNVLSTDMIDTVVIDLDIYNKGLNLYQDILDTEMSDLNQKTGVLTCLKNGIVDSKYCIEYLPLIKLLSQETKNYHKDIEQDLIRGKIDIRALITLMSLNTDLICVHIPIDLLLKIPDLVEVATNILYCTTPTINGVANINKFLSYDKTDKDTEVFKASILKKLKYVLCNVSQHTDIHPDDFTRWLVEYSDLQSLGQPTIGKIPHLENFDEYNDMKASIVTIKGIDNILRQIIIDLMK